MKINIHRDHPEVSIAVRAGCIYRQEALVLIIVKRALDDMQENLPKLWRSITEDWLENHVAPHDDDAIGHVVLLHHVLDGLIAIDSISD